MGGGDTCPHGGVTQMLTKAILIHWAVAIGQLSILKEKKSPRTNCVDEGKLEKTSGGSWENPVTTR